MAHGYAIVEHETVAAPFALRLGHLLKVLENAALEMKYLFEAGAKHITGGLLATDATSAEHGYFLVPCRIKIGLYVIGEFGKRRGVRIHGAFEGTDCHFVIVAGIDQQHFGVADQRVPVLRLDVSAYPLIGVHTRHAEGNDFLLELDLGAVE